jgi:hypothetical protein
MSRYEYDYFGSYDETKQQREDRDAELRRRANENLKKVYSGVYRREATAKRERKRTELELATALDIYLGHDVIQRRELNKELNRLLTMKREMTPEEQGAAEEMQMMIDRLDYGLSGYSRSDRSRFVRLWNKSRKQRYRL